jgi:hypothetical protein
VRNEAEKEMWADYEMHGAEFDAGPDELAPQARFKELGKEADMLGFWNPVAVARELGFGDERLEGEIGVEDEDEAVLAEILRNAGGCRCKSEMVRRGHMTLGYTGASDSAVFPTPVVSTQYSLGMRTP